VTPLGEEGGAGLGGAGWGGLGGGRRGPPEKGYRYLTLLEIPKH